MYYFLVFFVALKKVEQQLIIKKKKTLECATLSTTSYTSGFESVFLSESHSR